MTENTSGPEPFRDFWHDLIDDAEATAAEYEADGWDTYTLNTGEVTPRYGGEKPDGLSVLVPDPEFRSLEDLIDDSSFDNVEVYRNTIGPVVFLLVVERDAENECAILIPAYYNALTDSGFLDTITQRGEVSIHVRSLGSDHEISFTHSEHSLFIPDEEQDGTGSSDGAGETE